MGTQSVLNKPQSIDTLKRDMLQGDFDYSVRRAVVTGWYYDGVFYVDEGRHRINAALEIYWETGDRRPLEELLLHGDWDDRPPPPSCRFPTRTVFSRFLSLIGL